MPKKLISKQHVIDAAKILIANNHKPTMLAIRQQLNNCGSNSTIHKYLQEWKKSCFEQGNINTTVNLKNQKSIEELVERKHDLEKTLQKQTTQSKHYVQELINAEKANIALKEENHQLQITNQELKLRLTAAEATNNNLLQTTQEINNRLDINDNKIIQSMQQTIDDLRVELKTLNETSLTAIRETSNKAHETLMQEKVTSINLQTKIDSLHKELDQSHKQLELEQQNWQMQHLILQKQIKLQQKIIQTHLSQEKLQQLEQNGLELLT